MFYLGESPIAGSQDYWQSGIVVWGDKRNPFDDWLHQTGFSFVRDLPKR